MRIARDRPLLCFIHSIRGGPPEMLAAARSLIEAGGEEWGMVDLVQVRGKDLPAAELEALARVWIDALGRPRSTLVVVNDRLDVALAAGADGVHLGRADLPPAEARSLAPRDFLIGVSAHDRPELGLAQRSEADYAGLGAFYPTRTKAGAAVLASGDAAWRMPVPELTIPVVAIGGIAAGRVPEVMALPAVTGIAVSEAIQGAPDPAEAIRGLRSALDRAWRERQPEDPAEAP
ncbi:MAG TPA: thiamine phosphate synthase [Gemmatimonadota bacterium]|jgi:thiamine-phosphate pyrophosphorylase|nr:thiamine phosphate synthase [Gemmatimonadota bacterium]